jgi:heat shock protein HslJ
MKNIYIVTFLLFSILCKSQLKKNIFENNPNQLNRVWMLIEFKNFKKEELIKNQVQINLKDFKNPSVFVGCNQISLKTIVKNSTLKFRNIIRTEMNCAGKMKLEDAFLKSLSVNFTFKIKGQTLILINSKKEKMVFVAQDWD